MIAFLPLVLKLLPVGKVFNLLPGGGIIMVVAVAFCTGAGSTWYIKSKLETAERAQMIDSALAQQRETLQRVTEQGEAIRRLDDKTLAEASEKKEKVSKAIRYITKQVKVYVPVKSNLDCNYSVGAVSLLNAARQSVAASGKPRLPDAASLVDEALQATSTHSQQDEITSHLECVSNYNQLTIKHHGLINWLKENRELTQ